MRRIGIVGGTFDPIHLGHLMLGRQAYQEYQLDKVWYMPSRQPPHKQDHPVTSATDRSEMIRLAIRDIPDFELSDFELSRTGGNTYTADTLELLHESCPDAELFFIVGADSIFDIEKWYQPERVLRSAVFLAAGRDCGEHPFSLEDQITYLESKYGACIGRLHCGKLDISSEEIRRKISAGEDVNSLLPESVYQYIRRHQLYR